VKSGLRLGAIVLIVTVAAGCTAGGYDPNTLQGRLVKAGVAPAAAKCVIQGMTAKFGTQILGARVDPSAQEVNAERVILRRCQVKLEKP
jgi:hypothetical protein